LGVRNWVRVDVPKVVLGSKGRLVGKMQISRDAGFERWRDSKDGDM